MQSLTRRRLRLVAWAMFIVAAPLLLGYARGYRISWSRMRSGSLSVVPSVGAVVIRSNPSGAQVYVDGNIADTSTPSSLGNIPAGPHSVRLEKKGFRTFEKNLEVVAGRVTDLLAVLLIPTEVPETVLLPDAEEIATSPDGQWIATRSGSSVSVFRLRSLLQLARDKSADSPPSSVTTVRLPKLSPKPVDLIWSPKGTSLLVQTRESRENPETAPSQRYLISVPRGAVRTLQKSGRYVGWLLQDTEALLLHTPDGTLSSISMDDTSKTLLTGVIAAAIHPDGVVVQRSFDAGSSTLSLIDTEGTVTLLTDAPERPSAFLISVSPQRFPAVITGPERRLIVRAADDAWHTIAGGVQNVHWSPNGELLAYQTSEFDLYVVNIAEERSVLEPFRPQLLVRVSSPLRALRWFPDSARLLFLEQDMLKLVDVDVRGGPRVEVLASLNRADASLATPNTSSIIATAMREADSANETPKARSQVMLLSLRPE